MTLTAVYICDILKTALNLASGQVMLYNQRRALPTTSGMFLVVGTMGFQVIGNNRYHASGDKSLTETVCSTIKETLFIEAFSNDTSAVENLPKIIAALNSTYSLQNQEKYGFKIASIPATVNDTSFLETTSLLHRVSLTINVIRAYENTAEADFYDTFTKQIKTEKGDENDA